MRFPRLVLLPLLLSLPSSLLHSVTWHVDVRHGDDTASGRAPAEAFRTLQAAADRMGPGDVVLVAPGVYPEHVRITARGTPDAPITLQAAAPETGEVVVTGAALAIRDGAPRWEQVDARLNLHRIAHPDGWPARVLYDRVDAYPYATLDQLKAFATPNAPGPLHGYFYDATEKRLYLRLHPRHAARGPDLARYTVAVAPPTGDGFEGTIVSRPEHYNIAILGEGPAHIVIDGFTFETPGVAGVYVEASDVTIRNCRFFGCRTAVAGNYQERLHNPAAGYAFKNLRHDPVTLDRVAARIRIERAWFTQFPAFEDIADCAARLPAGELSRGQKYGAMWHRKSVGQGLPSEHFKYEIGIACRIGRDWVIEDSTVVSAFEGLSCHSVSGSEGLIVRRNLFARICDNGIETEDHARGMVVTDNVFLDVMEPFSWQPLRGLPWPTDIVFSRNVIANTPAYQDYWVRLLPGRGVFKIGAPVSNWRDLAWMKEVPRSPITLGGAGIEISRNLVYFPGGRLFTLLGDRKVPLPDIRIRDNFFAADRLFSADAGNEMAADHFTLVRNTSVAAREGVSGPGPAAAGKNGTVLPDWTAMPFENTPQLDFRSPRSDAPPWPAPDLRSLVEHVSADTSRPSGER